MAHGEGLAVAAAAAGALPPLVACLSPAADAPGPVRRYAASALSDASRHSPELAAAVVQAGTVGAIAGLLRAPLVTNDARLKKQLVSVLMHVARASEALAAKLVGANLVPDIGRWAPAGVLNKSGGRGGWGGAPPAAASSRRQLPPGRPVPTINHQALLLLLLLSLLLLLPLPPTHPHFLLPLPPPP